MARRSQHQAGMKRWGGPAAVLLIMSVVLGMSTGAGAATTPEGTASGNVASIAGTTMEVQSATAGQTSVTWTSSTTFSQTATESVSAVAVGDCLTVTGTKSKKSKTTIAARSITISQPSSSGTCTGGLGGGAAGGRFGRAGAGGAGRTGGGGSGFTPPGGTFPRGGAGGGTGAGGGARGSFAGAANLAIANGKVTAVSGSTVSLSGTLLSSLFNRPTSKSATKTSTKTTTKTPKLKTQKLKITTASSTTLSETQSTSSTALAVGDCVTAFGPSSSTGAVTASTVRITSTGGKTCTSGFGGGGFGGFGGGGGGGGGA